MSLWRVRHGLSPASEAALLVLAASVGILAIWVASLRPFAYPATIAIRSLTSPVSLDTDTWARGTNDAYGYAYGVPKDWVVDDASSTKVIIARNRLALGAPSYFGGQMTVSVRELAPGEDAATVAAQEFAEQQPALYDVAVAGHPGIFAVAFSRGHVATQAVYVPKDGRVYIFHGDGLDPAVFSTFISTIKFFTP